jgi:GNAT superfamily N-acetyltransferase
MVPVRLDSFLPGDLVLSRGTPRDYLELERFHYLPGRPATWAGVWVVRYVQGERSGGMGKLVCPWSSPTRPKTTGKRVRLPMPPGDGDRHGRLAAVAVLSYPTVNSAARDRALGLAGWPPPRKLALANRDVRTISRVVVHPQFRGVGLASRLVRTICGQCPTRWIEAYAAMGRVHPFFEKGGMTRYDPPTGEGPVYYLFERTK